MGMKFSSGKDIDEDNKLDERCCVLFWGYDPYKQKKQISACYHDRFTYDRISTKLTIPVSRRRV